MNAPYRLMWSVSREPSAPATVKGCHCQRLICGSCTHTSEGERWATACVQGCLGQGVKVELQSR